MFKYLILYALIAYCGIWARPLQPHSDVASHVVIVTPQAQVHLEPTAKFAPIIHHLTPLARIDAPHDETFVYVPARAGAPLVPIETLAHQAAIVTQARQNSQVAQIQQAFEQGQAAAAAAQVAAQEGFTQISQQLSEAAASLSPSSFFPSPGGSSNKDEKLKETGQTPANTQPLLPSTGRHFYAVASPVVPHIVDFVHTAPVIVSPVSVLRARSLEDAGQVPIVAVPIAEIAKPEALPLKTELKSDLKETQFQADAAASTEPEKGTTNDFGRFLEANALKTDTKQDKFDDQFKRDNLPLEQKDQPIALAEPEKFTESQNEFTKPQLKSVLGVVGGQVPVGVHVPGVLNSVVDDVVPQSKVA